MKRFGDRPDAPDDGSNQPLRQDVISRRQVLRAAGSAAAFLAVPTMLRAEHDSSSALRTAQASDAAPVPIPGGFNAEQAFGPRFPNRFFHLFLPGPGTEPSTIFNFQGKLAILNIHGTGIRSEFDESGELTDQQFSLPFATDVRFMQGTYVGVDGQQHQGTFAFF